jgi:predicted component of type VI protein secretion system
MNNLKRHLHTSEPRLLRGINHCIERFASKEEEIAMVRDQIEKLANTESLKKRLRDYSKFI